jgi:hypothetical protein
MATYTDQLVVLNSGVVTKIAASDIIEIGGDFTVGGNLTVNGTTTTINSEIQTADDFIFLNSEYTADTAKVGGIIWNIDPAATTFPVTTGAFSNANIVGVSVDPSSLSAGDIILVQGAADPANNGLFEVNGTGGGPTVYTITTRAILSDTDLGLQNTFVVDGTVQGTVVKVSVTYLRAKSTGGLETATGDNTGTISFTDLATSAGSTLQSAYDVGATITTASTTDIAFTLSSGNFVVNGGGQADFGISGTDLTAFGVGTGTFNVDATGAVTIDSTGAGISLDAAGASNFSTSSGNLSLGSASNLLIGATGASGNVSINSVNGDINIGNLANNGAINIGTGGTRTVTVGSATVDIVASSGTLDVPAGTSFKIGTTALTTANFTAANIDTLLDGSNADSLHTHGEVVNSQFVAETGGVTAGDALYLASGTEVGLADATTADGKDFVVGFAANTASATNTVNMNATPGATITTATITGFSAAGDVVYLSETAGELTTTAPSGTGTTIFRVGYAITSTTILFQPQFIALNP